MATNIQRGKLRAKAEVYNLAGSQNRCDHCILLLVEEVVRYLKCMNNQT